MMLFLLLRWTLFVYILSESVDANSGSRESIVSKTSYGDVEGEVLLVNGGFKVAAYRGIRYARPPFRERRFRAPEPPQPWTDIKKATRWPPSCIQTPIFGEDPRTKSLPENEDCLFLNVFAPVEKLQEFPNGYPVMFWVHGGGSSTGSTVMFGAKGITERLVPKGVVFVGVQYRLGIYGFLSTADLVAPGNWGLLDMVFALQWVKANIKNFNGDPNKVTVVGQSAGGAAAVLLSISPLSKDLVHQVVAMSGSTTSAWSVNLDPRSYLNRVAAAVDCDIPSYQQMLYCLMTKPVDELKTATLVNRTETVLRPNEFGPVEDGYFLPKRAEELLKEASPKPMLSGTTSFEFGSSSLPVNDWQETRWTFRDPEKQYQYQNFKNLTMETLPDDLFPNAAKLRRLVLDHYLAYGDKKNNSFLFEQYNKLMNDVRITVPQYRDALMRFNAGSKVWLYNFDYYNSLMFPRSQKFRGAYHGYELTYMFDVQLNGHFDFNDEDARMLELFPTLVTNFVKYGNPTPNPLNGFTWLPLSREDKTCYARLNLKPEMQSGYAQSEYEFWTKTISEAAATTTEAGNDTSTAKHLEL